MSTFLKLSRGDDPYQELRDKLCETYELPLEQKVDVFLAMKDIGDERPAEFAMELQRLLANASIDDVLKRVFVRCLPPTIVTAITGSLDGKFRTVVQAADKAWTAAAGASGGATPTTSVAAITGPPGVRDNRHGGGQCGNRSTGQITNVALCSFHKKFGDSARKCAQGCSQWGEMGPREPAATRVFHVEESLEGEDTNVGTTASENF